MCDERRIAMKRFVYTLIIAALVLISSESRLGATEDLQSTTPLLDGAKFSTAVQAVAEEVGPTVVSIKTVNIQRFRNRMFSRDPMYDEFLREFFKDFFGELPEQEFRRSGLGSGVIIDKRGYILTNEHVVGHADKIEVSLPDGRELEARLMGTDPRSDLAVIKIDAPDLPAALLGDSDRLRIGQWAVAIGNPFGNILSNPEPTVTVGVISALKRALPRTSRRDTDLSDLIQTDAAINPGNSGGPLVDLKGQVIGINVAIFTTSGGSQGIGFAIPINRAKRIVQSLIKGEKVYYGWIGVSVQDIDEDLAAYFGLPSSTGAMIVQVLDDGPAQKAGLQDGDVILAVDGQEVNNVNDLIRTISQITPGRTVTISLLRDEQKKDLPIEIGKRPMFDEAGRMIEDEEEEEPEGLAAVPKRWRGMQVNVLTSDIVRRFRLGAVEGVIITDIEQDSPADRANLREGDIILAINQRRIKDARDFDQAVAQAQGDCLIKTIRGYFVIKSE